MSTKNVFYCREDGVAFTDARPKRNCPECKETMLITGHFEDLETADAEVETSEDNAK